MVLGDLRFWLQIFENSEKPFKFFLNKKLQVSLENLEHNPENQKNRNNQKDKLARFLNFQT
jgi:hypothetical protein